MAANVSVELNGNRYVVKVTPMMPLAAVAEDACRQAKVTFDKAACTLTHAKTTVDLELPWRFANLISGAKLLLTVKGQGGRILGFQEPASSLVSGADQASRRDMPAGASAAQQQQQQQAPHPKQQGNSAANSTAGPASSGVQAGGSEAQAAPALEGAEKDVGRPFFLFSQEELANQADSRADTSEEDYEMTTKDYQALMAASKAKAVKDARLMTKAMREREEAALAASLPPVRVRIVLPGQLVLEARFKATDKVALLLDFVRKCLSPAARGGRWYLYSTPPKQVLENPEETLYKAGLVPAAKLYLGLPDATAAMGPEQLLMAQVLARKCAAAEVLNAVAQEPETRKEAPEAAGPISIPGVYVGTAAHAPAASQAGEKKVPKWLKMSK